MCKPLNSRLMCQYDQSKQVATSFRAPKAGLVAIEMRQVVLIAQLIDVTPIVHKVIL